MPEPPISFQLNELAVETRAGVRQEIMSLIRRSHLRMIRLNFQIQRRAIRELWRCE